MNPWTMAMRRRMRPRLGLKADGRVNGAPQHECVGAVGATLLAGQKAADRLPATPLLRRRAGFRLQLFGRRPLLGRQRPDVRDVVRFPGAAALGPFRLLEEAILIVEDASKAMIVIEDEIQV